MSPIPRLATMRRGVALAVGAVLVAAVACHGTEPLGRTVEQVTFADTLHIDLTQFTRLESGVYLRDSTAGAGPQAADGDTLYLHYVGRLPSAAIFADHSTGNELVVPLGEGTFIPGWEVGLVGMRPGGHRQLIVPSEMGYGERGTSGVPPGSVLLFDIDLDSLR